MERPIDPRAFRVALAELSATNARINALIGGDPRDADDIPGFAELDTEKSRWLRAVDRYPPATRSDLAALAEVMKEPGIVDNDPTFCVLGEVLREGVLAIYGRPRFPRQARIVVSYGLALLAAALSEVGLRIARRIARRRTLLAEPDGRLAALADEMEAISRDAEAYRVRHDGAWTTEGEAGFDDIIDRYDPAEEEMAATPAASLAGVLAKARACQVGNFEEGDKKGVAKSIADDLHRLFGGRHG